MGALNLHAHFATLVVASACLCVALGRLCDVDSGPGDGNFLNLDGQYWVDWFGREGCTEVPGGILLKGDVSDLSPLRNLSRVGTSDDGWSLLIYSAAELQSLAGLRGMELTTMPGRLWVKDCPQLPSLEGLEGIHSAGSLRLETLPRLRGLHGLRGLRGTLSEIRLHGSPLLRSLEGLEGLSGAGSVHLYSLEQMQDLRGLRGVQGVLAGGISIKQCRSLSSLGGLEAVTGLGATQEGWSLELGQLPNLTSLAPLRRLHGHMPGGLLLGDLPALESLAGLEGISSLNRSQAGHSLSLEFLNVTSLHGLSGLRGGLGGGIQVVWCHFLQSLDGLEGVTMLGRSAQGDSLHLHTLPSLTSLQGLRGLSGALPGSLVIAHAYALWDLEGLQGLFGVCSGGPRTGELGVAIRLLDCPSLRSVLGLRGLQGPLQGSLRLEALPALPTLAGFEGLTGISTAPGVQALNINCVALESLAGLRGLTSTLHGLAALSHRLQSLEAFAENITVPTGNFLIFTGGPICDRTEVLERLQAIEVQSGGLRALDVPPGQPPLCRRCPQPCSAYSGRRVTCDLLRGGCQCPLGRTGPDCVEAPVVDVALPLESDRRVLRVRRPPPSAGVARSLDLCVPLRRSAPANGSTAVRLRELLAGDDACLDSRDTGYSLLPPFNDVRWLDEDPTQGCLIAHLDVGTSPSDGIAQLRLVLAYESPSGGRYPDHLINGTLNETGDPWDHPWPDCLHINTCREQQDEVALTVHFLEQEDCPESMELDYSDCKATPCPGSGMSQRTVDDDGSYTLVLELQEACDCRQGQALEGRCVARPGYWALNTTSATPCPFSQDGVSTCLGGNRCTPGFEGVLCAACPAAQVQHSGGCAACSSGQGPFCVMFALLFLVLAGSLPHLLMCERPRSCSCLKHVQWRRVFTKLRITWLKVQELLVWSWGFLLVFPEVRQRLGGFHVVELLAGAFSSIAFPPFLQCGCGVDVFGEFGILVLAPTVFILVASASACWGAWRAVNAASSDPPTPAEQRWVLTRCWQLWKEHHGPQLLFCLLQVTFSPLVALIVVYAPAPGVGFHCLDTGEERQCFLRRDYRLRLESDQYASFGVFWWFAFALQVFALLLLLGCLTRTKEVRTGAMALFCAELKAERAPFELASLLRQTLLSAAVLLFPGGGLSHLYWSLLISAAYLALLHLFEPYRNRGYTITKRRERAFRL